MKKCPSVLLSTLLLAGVSASAQGGVTENSEISFCKETLPLNEWRIVAQFEKALQHTANLPLPTIRHNVPKFFRVIEPILANYQIPTDFKYLCIVESALDPLAMSSKGAFGFWQFMPETARSLGLTVNEQIDERQNLMASTIAACRYFKQLYQTFGSWTLVAAAYNAGPTKMREYAGLNRERNYYRWRINPETRQYLYRVIAVKEMLTRPHFYKSVLEKKQNFYHFIRNEGTLLGLTIWRTRNEKTKLFDDDSEQSPLLLSVCESLASGFDQLLPLPYKRTAFDGKDSQLPFTRIAKKPNSPVVNNGEADANSYLSWAALPFYSRRRDELYMIPPKVRLSVKKRILSA